MKVMRVYPAKPADVAAQVVQDPGSEVVHDAPGCGDRLACDRGNPPGRICKQPGGRPPDHRHGIQWESL